MNRSVDGPAWFREGGRQLEGYDQFGGGADLFRAYLNRRTADLQKSKAKAAANRAQLRTASPLSAEYLAALDELIMSSILEHLDPIIAELLAFCSTTVPADDQLAHLRRALRIDRGRAPYDVDRFRRKERALQRWESAYRQMVNTKEPKSERAMAREIATELGLSQSAVFSYWQECKRERPWLAAQLMKLRRIAEDPTISAILF